MYRNKSIENSSVLAIDHLKSRTSSRDMTGINASIETASIHAKVPLATVLKSLFKTDSMT